MTSVLVLGGTGKTGSEVAAALLSRGGVQVRVASRHPTEAKSHGVQSVKFDWDDEATWPGAVADIEALYLVKPKTIDPAKTVESFLASFQNLERLVLLSEIAAERQDATADELRVEKAIETGAFGWTVLRPNWFMQNFSTPSFFGDPIRKERRVTLPASGQAISFDDTRDIASAAVAALLERGHEGKHYTLTGPEALTVSEALGRIAAVAGYPISHVDPPLDDYLSKSAGAGASQSTIGYYRRVYSNIANGFDSVVTGDVETLTGRKARRFADFVEDYKSSWT